MVIRNTEKMYRWFDPVEVKNIIYTSEEFSDWTEFEEWGFVEVGRSEDWDGTEVFEDEIAYDAKVFYHNGEFEILFIVDGEEFEDEDELIEWVEENY